MLCVCVLIAVGQPTYDMREKCIFAGKTLKCRDIFATWRAKNRNARERARHKKSQQQANAIAQQLVSLALLPFSAVSSF